MTEPLTPWQMEARRQRAEPETAAGRALTPDEWADELALIISKARYGPGLDMGGRHNPKPSEAREARIFVDAILDATRAKTFDDVAALVRELPTVRNGDVTKPRFAAFFAADILDAIATARKETT